MLISLKPNEQILKTIRRCGITYFWWFWLIFILIAAPFFFMFLLFSWGKGGVALFLGSMAMGLFLFIRLIYFWHRNALIVTNQRIVDISQKGSINRVVTELNYDKIHHVSYQIKGVAPTIFRYGRIRIQTVGGQTDLEFSRVKKPAQVQEIISQALAAYLEQQNRAGGRESALSLMGKINQLPKEELEALKNVIESRLKIG